MPRKVTDRLPKPLLVKSAEAHMCYFPFTQLLLQPTGLVSPCCWNQEFVAGNIENEKIIDIWNGPKMQKLRQEFLDNNPVSCEQQMRHLGCHRWSHRLKKTANYSLTPIQSTGPKRLDLRLNGRCNLQCVMCDVWKQPNGLYDASDFWEIGPTKIFPFLVELDMLGGEPFIQPDTYRMIREVSSVNKMCTWSFVTNGQYRLGSVVLNHLDLIPLRWIQVSIDSLDPDNYKAIRPGSGDLKRVISTLKELLTYRYERLLNRRGFDVTISICVQKQNWHEVGDFLDFAQELKVTPILQFAYIPESESLLSFELAKRTEVLGFFESLLGRHRSELLSPVISPMKDSLRAAGEVTQATLSP